MRSFALTGSTRLGPLSLCCFPVDHSIFGACAFGVETDAGWLLYTGDLRLHGKEGHLTREFIEAARGLKPFALICEGTYADESTPTSEEEVHENALNAARTGTGLVVADFAPRNIERLLTFRQIALDTNRRLVILAKDAYLLDAMRCVSAEVPDILTDEACLVYSEPKGTVANWEKEIRKRYSGKLITAKDVHEHQDEYVLCFSFWDVNELIDIQPSPGGVYIYSTSEAFTEDQRIDLERLRNWLGHFKMRMVGDPDRKEAGFHASGHISGPELLELIRTVNPQIVIPVHTESPQYFFENLHRDYRVYLPARGQPIALR